MFEGQAGELVKLVREAGGQTQSELATNCGVSQSKLSKIEKGLLEPAKSDLKRITRALGIPLKLFSVKEPIRGPGVGFEMYYRKQASTGRRLLRQVEARLELYRLGISNLLNDVELEVDYELPEYDPDDDDPEDIAHAVRVGWQIPSGPIRQLAPVLESAGIILIPMDFGTSKIDAVSVPSPRMRPLIFYRPDAPGCRQRLSLSHELGHIIMHRFPTEDMEDQANEFAASFLMPHREFEHDLRGIRVLRIEHLAALKQKWFVSMSAIARRAHELDLITDWNYKNLNIELSKRGWRKKEPVAVRPERSELFSGIIQAYLEDGFDYDELQEISYLKVEELRYQADPFNTTLRVVR